MGEGYREWQVIQAACNIALKYIAPELFVNDPDALEQSQSQPSTVRVLEFLLGGHETVARVLPPLDLLSVDRLREQIHADANELLQYVTGAEIETIGPDELQAELFSKGLLEE